MFWRREVRFARAEGSPWLAEVIRVKAERAVDREETMMDGEAHCESRWKR